MSTRTYLFREVKNCNMCGAPTEYSQVTGQRLDTSLGLSPREKYGISVSVIKCSDCGLLYANPLPIPSDIQDHYGVPADEYWDCVKSDQKDNDFSTQITKIKKLVGHDIIGCKALDIGSGRGHVIVALNRVGFDTYGLEASETFRRYSIDRNKIDPSKLQLGMIENADYPENYFDFITFGAVLEHLYDPSKSITQAMKWLKPGGVVQIEVPSSRHLPSKLINFYFRLLGTNYVTNLSPMHKPFHLYEFDLKSFRLNSTINHYNIVDYYFYVCKIYHLPRIIHPLLRYVMKKTNSGMQLEVWLSKKDVSQSAL